ncbi:type II toxin-antitoxin system PemK/MazF family toxin [Amycolatopsis alkalitolerans]|uniref:Type II toxin-antitoxin system PemK/MazF family toxin n=1 Tax=Amycolatopsis alkalitolerans TaxID=2547244 RepID=A0A5C4M700_9PSEU|nr:type II toxin-antitoxin system PemK/MazF family toxin [Amycolatopsis alkalitolerans]TNC28661.1 type II toxin-antitoxin system PemK/MazF family toxin [Amycolatopsis alkalitolerans]
MTRTVWPWQVWWVDFDPQVGREQAGQRPAVVVGSAFACELPNDLVLVVPCTTKDRGLPFQPRLDSLGQSSFAMCDQLKSISRRRLVRQHSARLDKAEIEAIRFVLRRLIEV